MKNTELVRSVVNIAKNYKTLYVMGCFGAPMTAKNKQRYVKNNPYNTNAVRTKMIQSASEDTFGFDCICLIKGVLWGWNGDKNASYGGAKYASNNVPDIGADGAIKVCSGVSTDFSNIELGELVWMPGHVGVYIGNGLAVECSPKWASKVQITAVGNIGAVHGYNTRTWKKHGKMPWVEYVSSEKEIERKEINRYPIPTRTLKYKVIGMMHGDDVKWVQYNLYLSALLKAKDIDGWYGNTTRDAVKVYQQSVGFTGKDVDGIVGNATRSKMLEI